MSLPAKPGLTRVLAERIAGIEFSKIPAEAVETVKRGIIDCVGVLFAGREEAVTSIVLASIPPGDDATVLFGPRKARSADAALVNATAAHALDYDDTGLDGHPSVVLVPTVFAEGERLRASGRDLITAYVAGYETWAELVGRDTDKLHAKGWHPTAVFGVVAAAAAASRLARLSPEQTACALGIAASLAGGLVANFGSMTKPYQAGRAAQNGVTAARLAAAGMTASPDAIEHASGFLAAFSPHGKVRTDASLGEWNILRHGLNVKRYPVCYGIHRAIDAILDLQVAAADVESVEVRIGRLQARMLRHSAPQTALDAKFSAQFAMACALLRRRVGLAELTDDFVRSDVVQKLMQRVHVRTADEVDPQEPIFAPHDAVSIRLRSGTVVDSKPVSYARGHARNPIGLDELRAKFRDCSRGEQDKFFERLLRLEEADAVGWSTPR